MKTTDWTIDGSRGNPIYGTTHEPAGEPIGVILLAHGFMGYKDYGMFPWLADNFANKGYLAHRFNFSHSGMPDGSGPFDRLDLFEQSTWNRQVEDLHILAQVFSMPDIPFLILGHSRGGVSTLLALGRGTVEADSAIVLSSPSECLSMDEETQQKLLVEGRIEVTSGRTGQELQVGKAFLEEQLEHPEDHDLLTLAQKIDVPCLLIHGENDPTVSVSHAVALSSKIKQQTLARITGGDHVFNTTNPFSIGSEPSCQLTEVWSVIAQWLQE